MNPLHAPTVDCNLPGFNSAPDFVAILNHSSSYLETSHVCFQADGIDERPQSSTLPLETCGNRLQHNVLPIPSPSSNGSEGSWLSDWVNDAAYTRNSEACYCSGATLVPDNALALSEKATCVTPPFEASMFPFSIYSPDHSLSGPPSGSAGYDFPIPTPESKLGQPQRPTLKAEITSPPPKKNKKKRGPVNCSVCDVRFDKPYQLREHMRGHGGRFKCETCGQTFAEVGNLSVHKKKHQVTPQPCKKCSKVFTKPASLREHLKSHDADRRKVTCPREGCGREYLARGGLNRHLKEIHLKEDYAEEGVKCGDCGREFKRLHGLERHRNKYCRVARERRATAEEAGPQLRERRNQQEESGPVQLPLPMAQPLIETSFQQAPSEWADSKQAAWSGVAPLDETLEIGEQAFMSTDFAFELPQQEQPAISMEMGLQEDLILSEFVMDGIFFEQGFDQLDLLQLDMETQLYL